MTETAYRMEYLFCCFKRPITNGCDCNLKSATQMISFLGILISIPVIVAVLQMNWKEYQEVPIIFAIYKSSGLLAPILMFIGSMKMDFGICYIGYIMHTIYVYGLLIFFVFIGLFWGLLILPAVIVSPPVGLFLIFYFMFCFGYLGILLYFNDIYFSYTKFLGQGEVRVTYSKNPTFIMPQGEIISSTTLINGP